VFANRLAWYIYYNFSRWGNSVDIVAHSMGGLIASVAVSGTQHPNSDPFNNTANAFTWPPYIYVQDVSTLNTPFQGSTQGAFCSVAQNNTQCRELAASGGYQVNGIDRPNFIQYWITPWGNPQAYYLSGRGGTDWTLIGSSEDWVVGEESALEWSNQAIVGHKILYAGGGGVNEPLGHSDLYKDPLNGIYHQYSCHYYNLSSCDESPDFCLTCQFWGNVAGWGYNSAAEAPIVAAAYGDYYVSAL
jgi:triacylglycerol esterase/lipase EstA (alpha/beta hydrolase family)